MCQDTIRQLETPDATGVGKVTVRQEGYDIVIVVEAPGSAIQEAKAFMGKDGVPLVNGEVDEGRFKSSTTTMADNTMQFRQQVWGLSASATHTHTHTHTHNHTWHC